MFEDNVIKFQNVISKKLGQVELLKKQSADMETRLSELIQLQDVHEKVIILLQKASEYAREQMKATIENIVTNALQVVFQNDMKFVIDLGTRAGSATAEFFIITPEGLKIPPMDAKGGGLVDVISTALRLAILEIYKPKIGGPIILDEVGKHISSDYAENFAYFLKEYGDRVGRQIILVTHNNALAAAGDKHFKVTINNGVSEVLCEK